MATVTLLQPSNMLALTLPTTSGEASTAIPSASAYLQVSGVVVSAVHVYGTGPFIDGNGNDIPSTVTRALFDTEDGDMTPNFDITGLSHNVIDLTADVLGMPLTPFLAALLSGNDTIRGTPGADVLAGYAGSDTFYGGAGGDAFLGGTGTDTVSNANASKRVIVVMRDPQVNTGDAAGDTFDSIENITGTNFNDIIYGPDGSAVNVLKGGKGNDILAGLGGGDRIDGGSGTDTAIYDASLSGVTADLMIPTNNTGDARGDKYISIENLDGSSFNDKLYGNNSANVLRGIAYPNAAAARTSCSAVAATTSCSDSMMPMSSTAVSVAIS
ncbi:MAG: calcium-binding protein [Hyphomicrobiaceae bacterium]